MSEPDYILDLGGTLADKPPVAHESAKPPEAADGSTPGQPPAGRPFISVHFACCNVFNRVYLNAAGTAYVGWCPRCARKVAAKVGPDGTTARTFQAG